MRGTCSIVVKRNGVEEPCGKPSVYSQPCLCDTCDVEPGYHLPMHLCAEHYDRITASPMGCGNCGGNDHDPVDCPEPDSLF